MKARMRCLLAACLSIGYLAAPATAQEDVRFEVVAEHRQVKSGDEVVFAITLRNEGDVAASNVKISARFSVDVEPIETAGSKESPLHGKDNTVIFPAIASLDAGETTVLKVRVRVKRAGVATCCVSVTDAGLGGLTLRKDEAIRVK